MRERLAALCPFLTAEQLTQFETYYAMLVDWNTRMNLTALTAPEDVAEKHFADSLLPLALVPETGGQLVGQRFQVGSSHSQRLHVIALPPAEPLRKGALAAVKRPCDEQHL